MYHELIKNQKNCHFEVSSFLTICNNKLFLYQIMMYDEKWISYNNQQWPAQWLDWEEAPSTSQSKLHPKNVIVTVWWSAAHLTHYSFLNFSETIIFDKYAQWIDEVHQKLQCRQQWSIKWTQFFSKTMPTHMSHNQQFKSWTNWTTKFCLIRHIHLTSSQLTNISFKHHDNFCRENASTTSWRQEMLSKLSWSMDFYATGINKLIFYWQKYVDWNGSYFD